VNAPDRPDEVTLTRHAPERGRGAPEILPAGCCCCCCCLHTIGGITGAVIGSATGMPSRPAYDSDPDAPFPYRRDVFEEDQPLLSPVLLYWLMVALAVVATIGAAPFVSGWGGGGGGNNVMDDLAGGLFMAIMFLPALQLVASFLAVILVAVFYPERGYALRRLGRITIFWFAGTALGMLLMGGCLLVLGLTSM
jgi:hypothetical protein